MIVDASSSNPLPLPSELLAPGFRFHPTDEELVGYYLKRKVSGRPLRVDAIAEVDLYKAEPWDLPALSRLQSRDLEWYFFSPLDRKYATRSRTNRATAQGYWKTTGKDRPISRGPRTVGMKKTLVFHVGRAPRGERTNWVMHEYRLEDEELATAGIPQDAYVVCRIFQKSGPGPQNGAQYGGSFVEEEWEEADDSVLAIEGGCNGVAGSGDEDIKEYLQLNDFTHSQDQGNQHESNGLLMASRDVQNGGSHTEDPFLLETFQNQSFIDMNTGLAALSYSPPGQNDGFMELNDIVDAATVDYPSNEDSVDYFLGTHNGQIFMNGGDERNNLPEVHEVEEFFDTVNENIDPSVFQIQDDFVLEPNDLLYPTAGDCPSDRTAEDNMVFYDADSSEFNFMQMNDLLYSPMADPSDFNLVDDIMAYFDNTENNLHVSTFDLSSEKWQPIDSCVSKESNFAPEVGGSSVRAYGAKYQPLEANAGRGASSSERLPEEADNQSNKINEEFNVTPDSQGEKDCDRTLTRRLVNMMSDSLGFISAPPAFAIESPAASGKSSGQISATNSGSSIHFTTGMIQIQGFRLVGRAEHWSLHKNEDLGLHLSYGIASGGGASKSGGFEPATKIQGWAMSVMLRGGFYLFLVSALFLAVSFKVGMHVCSR